MSILAKLQEDMKQALRAKDGVTLSTIRLILSSVSYARIEKGDELTDDEVIAVISKAAKQRKESIESAKSGNRMDIAEKEKAELDVITKYLPEQLSESDVEAIAKEIIAEVGASDMKDRGKVMGPLMQKIKGKADGKVASSVVEKLLKG
ncbi:MAG: GatB/YqeY domain-containing protein [Armatimonadota bacterium]